jgi:hypothetical protein
VKTPFLRLSLWILWTLAAAAPAARAADVLVGTNGERLVGKVIAESADAVVFESELGGRLTVPRAKIKELEVVGHPALVAIASTPAPATLPAPAAGKTTKANWVPPGVGQDGFDWIQLSSHEWLKGELKYIQDRKVDFVSDKLDEQSLKLEDILQLHTARPMFTKFDGQDQVYGSVVINGENVQVFMPEEFSKDRGQLTGITPGGEKEKDFWSLKATAGVTIQSGNTSQTSATITAAIARRTPNTQVLLDYFSTYANSSGITNADNTRVNATYDVRLSRKWFVRPVQLEWYQDQLANLASQTTAGLAAGYYFFDRDGLEWKLSAGPSYRRTRYASVEAGHPDTTNNLAGVLQTTFKADLTRRISFDQTFSSSFTNAEAGGYSHHSVSTLEFEIKRKLNLDLSLVWDYLKSPQTQSDGTVPKHSDFRFVTSLGVEY